MVIVKWMLVAVCALFFSGCKNKEKEARRAQLIALMHGIAGDADIAAAMEKARETRGEFLAALQNPGPKQRQFMVRKVFPARDAKQQILWVTDLRYDGALLHGRVNDNTAQPGSGVPRDGTVSFPAEEIADWMYNDDGLAAGGFTLRALKAKLTPEEWAGYAEKITFKE